MTGLSSVGEFRGPDAADHECLRVPAYGRSWQHGRERDLRRWLRPLWACHFRQRWEQSNRSVERRHSHLFGGDGALGHNLLFRHLGCGGGGQFSRLGRADNPQAGQCRRYGAVRRGRTDHYGELICRRCGARGIGGRGFIANRKLLTLLAALRRRLLLLAISIFSAQMI